MIGARGAEALAPPQVSVAIVNWNTRDHLAACLESLGNACVGLHAEIVVVDNASSDGSAAMVAERFPDVKLIPLQENVGFAGANNIAFRESTGACVLVLNPDIIIGKEALRGMLRFLEARPDAAAVGVAMRGVDGRVQAEFYRRFPSRSQILLFYTLLGYASARVRSLRERVFEHAIGGAEPVDVEQLPGACVMVRREVIGEVGPMDPDFFIWFEDVDWCYRMRRHGYGLYVLPGLSVTHAGGSSFTSWSIDRRVTQFFVAMTRFLCKHRLDHLLEWQRRIVAADLLAKELLIRGRLAIPIRPRGPLPNPDSLRRLRHRIHEIVRRYRAGELVQFDDRGYGFEPMRTRPRNPGDPVDVVIVNWNGRTWLPGCMDAVQKSTAPVRLHVVDNASSDDSVEYLRTSHPTVDVIELQQNVGYAEAANIGLRRARGPLAMVMNPDVLLAPDHIAVLRRRMQEDAAIGAAQGLLYAITASDFVDGRSVPGKIDSGGHLIRRSRMVVDRWQGLAPPGASDAESPVFSACGAALMLRGEMLDDLDAAGNWFDSSFFAYKEDIDLGWRARLLGWDVRYIPEATAWHIRAVPGPGKRGRGASAHARRHSWMNHWLLMIKNDRLADVIRHLPWILAWEVGRAGHALFRDPSLLPAYLGVWARVPEALRQRRTIRKRRRAGPREISRWFGAEPPAEGRPNASPRRTQAAP